ncbi:MAG: hypothetical protein KGI92_02270, partial [Alphaproteobacteria bacterium]|nr:hypothetical protein [Alphaproteobacteria bacterium]
KIRSLCRAAGVFVDHEFFATRRHSRDVALQHIRNRKHEALAGFPLLDADDSIVLEYRAAHPTDIADSLTKLVTEHCNRRAREPTARV